MTALVFLAMLISVVFSFPWTTWVFFWIIIPNQVKKTKIIEVTKQHITTYTPISPLGLPPPIHKALETSPFWRFLRIPRRIPQDLRRRSISSHNCVWCLTSAWLLVKTQFGKIWCLYMFIAYFSNRSTHYSNPHCGWHVVLHAWSKYVINIPLYPHFFHHFRG